MLRKIATRPLDANVILIPLGNDLFALDFEYNRLAFLRAGSRIWHRKENMYEVYELTENLPASTDKEIEDSIERISEFLNHRCGIR